MTKGSDELQLKLRGEFSKQQNDPFPNGILGLVDATDSMISGPYTSKNIFDFLFYYAV